MSDTVQEATEPEVELLVPDTATSKAGSKAAGTPQWNAIEIFAGCKAVLAANERAQSQKVPDLEAYAQSKFAYFVTQTAAEEGTWSSNQGKFIGWTPEKSGEIRGHPAAAK
eukprot:2688602-Pleurochrysis_carterae.AAC.1